tara:strand:- start:364 stop:1221 length:858 start_codon:yes stop_codon:yes gene_type:complete
MEKVDVVLMSAMKSGSTWLAQIIKNHNEVNLIQPKTTIYNENNELKIDKLSKTKKNILRYNLKLDYNIHSENFNSEEIFVNNYLNCYFNHNPNMKFITLLRNPLHRTFSHFKHYCFKMSSIINWKKYKTTNRPIEGLPHPDAISLDPFTFDMNIDIIKRKHIYESFKLGWISKSYYYLNLKQYFQLYNVDTNFFIIPMEEAISNRQIFFDKLCNFLEIEKYKISFFDKKINSSSNFRIKRNTFFYEKIYFNQLNEESLSFLRELFKKDVIELSDKLNYDFYSYWR